MPLTTIRTSNLDPNNGLLFRNRVINGDMQIDQRNAGAAVTASGSCILDRFINYRSGGAYTAQRSTTAPAGFVNSMLMTNTTSASPTTFSFFGQIIEGLNIADLGFGTANAQAVTVSFWANSSVAGIYSISVTNGNGDRAYPAQYTINTINTWEYKTITVPGDTTGTWATNNTSGIFLRFNLGSPSARTAPSGAWVAGNYDGANGSTGATTWANTTNATFYITGVQLEKGTAATAFERRPYGTELALCQRYYYLIAKGTDTGLIGSASYFSSTRADGVLFIPTSMRSVPTFSLTTGASYYRVYLAGSSYSTPSISLNGYTANYSGVYFYNNTNLSSLSNGSGWWETMNASAFIALTAEL
jgi:hypothetical protein